MKTHAMVRVASAMMLMTALLAGAGQSDASMRSTVINGRYPDDPGHRGWMSIEREALWQVTQFVIGV